MILNIIKQYEYTPENHIILINKYQDLETEFSILQRKYTTLEKEHLKLKQDFETYKPVLSQDEKKLIKNQNICSTETSIGYILFIFKCNLINRYKTGFCRIDAFEQTKETLLKIDTDGEMIYSVKIFNPYYEKLMVFLLKKNGFTQINSNTFDGLVDDFKIIIEIVTLLESLFNKDLFFTRDFLKAECHNITNKEILEENEPVIKKAKRSIDKVDPATLQT